MLNYVFSLIAKEVSFQFVKKIVSEAVRAMDELKDTERAFNNIMFLKVLHDVIK